MTTDWQCTEYGGERIKNYVKPNWWLSEQRLNVCLPQSSVVIGKLGNTIISSFLFVYSDLFQC